MAEGCLVINFYVSTQNLWEFSSWEPIHGTRYGLSHGQRKWANPSDWPAK